MSFYLPNFQLYDGFVSFTFDVKNDGFSYNEFFTRRFGGNFHYYQIRHI